MEVGFREDKATPQLEVSAFITEALQGRPTSTARFRSEATVSAAAGPFSRGLRSTRNLLGQKQEVELVTHVFSLGLQDVGGLRGEAADCGVQVWPACASGL